MECIEQVKARKMDPAEAAAVSKLAGQINASLKIELDARIAGELRGGELGAAPIGEAV